MICFKCKKEISDDEYVVNWGSCSECFDASYDEYLKNKEKEMKNVVLYHGNCFDGMASAWAAWKKLGDDAEYRAVNYGGSIPAFAKDNDELKTVNLYIVDFSFNRELLLNFKSNVNELVVLDHHKTAQKDLEGLDFCIFDTEKSGARLTWEYFHAQQNFSVLSHQEEYDHNIPKLIQYVEDRDLWRFKLPYSHEINAYIQSFPMDVGSYEHISENLEMGFEQCIAEGSAIERYKNTMVETQAKAAKYLIIGGYSIPVVNSSILFSEVGNYLCQHDKMAPFAAYYVDRADGKRQWGLRSIGDFDVSRVAKKYGGGGHKNAAGFITDLDYYGD